MSDSSIGVGEKRAHNTSTDNGNGTMDIENNASGIERSEFVVVSDNSGDAMELPTAPDNSLFMTTLQSSYPGATGMKYKNPKTGALRAVAVDATGTKLLPPADGWDDKVFTVITTRGERGSDVSVKRRKIGTSDGESDSDGEGRVGRKRAADARMNEPAAPRRPVDLIVLGVNYKTTDEGFKKYFEAFGTVSFAEIKRTAEGSSKGFGFVQMSTLEEQNKVLATSSHMLDGRRCEIRIPDQKHPFGQDHGGPPSGSRGGVAPPKTLVNKIFVGRLTEKVTDETLREFFDKEAKQVTESASVTDVFIPRPFRGFAFVTFTHAEVAEKMVKANNFVIDGMSVVVTLAVPREEQQQSVPSGVSPGYFNDYGYPYGYGKGGSGYGGSPGGPIPFPARDMFGYSPPPGVYPRAPYEGWVAPPSSHQGTPRSIRGGGAHEQPWKSEMWRRRAQKERESRNHPPKEIQPAAYPGPGPQQGPSPVVQPMAYMYPREGLAGQAASNQIASGLDALNLNQKNPELISAAWNAFFNTLSHGGASPQPHKKW